MAKAKQEKPVGNRPVNGKNEPQEKARRSRMKGGFAVCLEQNAGDGETLLNILKKDLENTLSAESWLRENAQPDNSYMIIQVKRSGIQVRTETVTKITIA